MDGTGLDERDLAEAEVKKKKKKDRLSKKKERSNSKSDPLGKVTSRLPTFGTSACRYAGRIGFQFLC